MEVYKTDNTLDLLELLVQNPDSMNKNDLEKLCDAISKETLNEGKSMTTTPSPPRITACPPKITKVHGPRPVFKSDQVLLSNEASVKVSCGNIMVSVSTGSKTKYGSLLRKRSWTFYISLAIPSVGYHTFIQYSHITISNTTGQML